MCRPPDLTAASGAEEYTSDGAAVEESLSWDVNVLLNTANSHAAASRASGSALLGKRGFLEEAQLADDLSRSAKFPRSGTGVSSAFDTAAASFVMKMEQSLLQDLQLQQQQRLEAAAVDNGEALLHRALLEQQAKVQQLKLLKQLRNGVKSQLLPEPQYFLLQQQVQRQSQALPQQIAASVPQFGQAAALAETLKQDQLCSSSAGGQSSAESKFQAWMQNRVGLSPSPSSSVLPPIQPKPAVTGAALATMLSMRADHTPAALGFGRQGLAGYQSAAIVLDDQKKAKRMQSNRASAKRSRQRRQQRLDELDKSQSQLQDENSALCVKLEEAQEQIHSLEDKNLQLIEEVACLRKILGLSSPLSSVGCSKQESDTAGSRGGQSSSAASAYSAQGSDDSGLVMSMKAPLNLVVEDEIDQLGNLLGLEGPPPSPFPLLPQGDVLSELLACFDSA